MPYTLRKRDAVLSQTKAIIRKTTHKYGIEITTNVTHANAIDQKNKNHYWQDALAKEMIEVGVAFEILDDGIRAPIGWSKVTGHLFGTSKCISQGKPDGS